MTYHWLYRVHYRRRYGSGEGTEYMSLYTLDYTWPTRYISDSTWVTVKEVVSIYTRVHVSVLWWSIEYISGVLVIEYGRHYRCVTQYTAHYRWPPMKSLLYNKGITRRSVRCRTISYMSYTELHVVQMTRCYLSYKWLDKSWVATEQSTQAPLPHKQHYLTRNTTSQATLPHTQHYLTSNTTSHATLPHKQHYLTSNTTSHAPLPHTQHYLTRNTTWQVSGGLLSHKRRVTSHALNGSGVI